MSVVNIANNSGIFRSTNTPVMTSCSIAVKARMTAYVGSATEIINCELDADNLFYLEGNGSTAIIQYTETATVGNIVNIFTDTYTGWFFWAASCDATEVRNYYLRDDTNIWTVGPTNNPASWTAGYISLSFPSISSPSNNDPVEFAFIKFWDAVLTEDELRAEAYSRKPVRWADLSFWNPMFSNTDCNIDYSNTGGNMTQTGTITTVNNDDPLNTSWHYNGAIYTQY